MLRGHTGLRRVFVCDQTKLVREKKGAEERTQTVTPVKCVCAKCD